MEHFQHLLEYYGIGVPPNFVVVHILGIEEWGEESREITVDTALFFGVSVVRVNGINILNGVLDPILKAYDEQSSKDSFHEINQWKNKSTRDWTDIFWTWTAFREEETGSWLWYGGTETVTVVTGSTAFGMPITRTVTRDVGGIYDDSSINYILAGHACKKLGVPLWFAVTGARMYNRYHNKNWGINDVFWLKKGYNEYGLRNDW